jgi:hypothetical protein
MERLKNIVSGRTTRSNRLIGDHALRICEKLEGIDSSFLAALAVEISESTAKFLDSVFFNVRNFKYDDGTIEVNPFRQNMDLLSPEDSFVVFKLVAGNYLVHLIAEEHVRGSKDRACLSETKNQFFSLYEYEDEDIEIFDELLELITTYERPTPEIRLYERIFERAFRIDAPQVLYHMLEFESLFMNSFNKSFLPHFLERLRISSESRRPAIGVL